MCDDLDLPPTRGGAETLYRCRAEGLISFLQEVIFTLTENTLFLFLSRFKVSTWNIRFGVRKNN
jgi:hypothetical protein